MLGIIWYSEAQYLASSIELTINKLRWCHNSFAIQHC